MTQQTSIFRTKRMNEWLNEARTKPPVTPLYSPWWNVGETCFFFGSTGIGKTLYAMQIARQVAVNQKVLYFDFELSDIQQYQRYASGDNILSFPENFIRVEMRKDLQANQKVIIAEIKKEVRQTGAKVIIIDNITWILDDGQDAKMAIPFMKEIVSLKNENNISIMIIAHTPKRKPMTTMIKGQLVSYDTPLELSDMAGSAALNNFIDSCFAIGKSRQDDSLRYIKQLKSRSSELIHGSDNVINFSIGRDENGFLSLIEMGNGPEINHLQTPPRDRVEARRSQVNTLHSQGLSYREIGRRLGISHTQVRRDIEA